MTHYVAVAEFFYSVGNFYMHGPGFSPDKFHRHCAAEIVLAKCKRTTGEIERFTPLGAVIHVKGQFHE